MKKVCLMVLILFSLQSAEARYCEVSEAAVQEIEHELRDHTFVLNSEMFHQIIIPSILGRDPCVSSQLSSRQILALSREIVFRVVKMPVKNSKYARIRDTIQSSLNR